MKFYYVMTIVILLPASLAAQFMTNEIAEENEFVGKWQEYQRTDYKKRKELIGFNDTLQLQFMPDSTVRIWYSNGKYFNERIAVDKKGLHFGDAFLFSKYKLRANTLTLRNGNELHYFNRVEKLVQGPIKKVVPGVKRGNVNLSPSQLKGRWENYKKEDKAFSRKKHYLKTLEITDDDGRGNYSVKGSMASYIDKIRFEGTMSVAERTMTIIGNEERYVFEIIRLENNEMTLSRYGAIIFLMDFGK